MILKTVLPLLTFIAQNVNNGIKRILLLHVLQKIIKTLRFDLSENISYVPLILLLH